MNLMFPALYPFAQSNHWFAHSSCRKLYSSCAVATCLEKKLSGEQGVQLETFVFLEELVKTNKKNMVVLNEDVPGMFWGR